MNSSISLRSQSRKAIVALLGATTFLFAIPAHAAAPKWEYAVENAKLNNRNLTTMLNNYGAQGWELVQINNQGVAIFKRATKK